MFEVNAPRLVAELREAFEAYERALMNNDIEGLNALFWNSPNTLRYGAREIHYGHAAIARFRRDRGPIGQSRTLRNTRITTFGNAFGVANTEFVPAGTDKTGRQSQTWIKTDAGWKIVSAHVSFLLLPNR